MPAMVFAVSSSHRNHFAPTPRCPNISIDEGRSTTKILGIVKKATRMVEIQKVIFTFFEAVAIREKIINNSVIVIISSKETNF